MRVPAPAHGQSDNEVIGEFIEKSPTSRVPDGWSLNAYEHMAKTGREREIVSVSFAFVILQVILYSSRTRPAVLLVPLYRLSSDRLAMLSQLDTGDSV